MSNKNQNDDYDLFGSAVELPAHLSASMEDVSVDSGFDVFDGVLDMVPDGSGINNKVLSFGNISADNDLFGSISDLSNMIGQTNAGLSLTDSQIANSLNDLASLQGDELIKHLLNDPSTYSHFLTRLGSLPSNSLSSENLMSQLQSEMLNSIKSQTPENIFFNQEQKIENVLNQAQGFNPFEV